MSNNDKIKTMKEQTIGVEVEMNNITREDAAKIAENFFGTNGAKYTGHVNGYRTWSAWDQQGREWKFQRDSSINGPDDEKCELVTPILHYEDIEMLQELCRRLRKAGAKSDATRGCGIHIHIGAEGHTPKSIRNLVNLMKMYENNISDVIGIDSWRKSRYCQNVDERFFKEINSKKPKTMSDLSDIWYESHCAEWDRNAHYNDSRYHMLNLHATFTKGTIEFRCFQFDAPADGKQNGIHAGQLKAYIQFCMALSNAAKCRRYVRTDRVAVSRARAMKEWLLSLGLQGDEFATARKFMTRGLSTQWERAA